MEQSDNSPYTAVKELVEFSENVTETINLFNEKCIPGTIHIDPDSLHRGEYYLERYHEGICFGRDLQFESGIEDNEIIYFCLGLYITPRGINLFIKSKKEKIIKHTQTFKDKKSSGDVLISEEKKEEEEKKEFEISTGNGKGVMDILDFLHSAFKGLF
jgi:hypothetical protein